MIICEIILSFASFWRTVLYTYNVYQNLTCNVNSMSITNARRICIVRVNIANIFDITATHTRNYQLNPCGSIIKSRQAIFHFHLVSDVTLSPAIYKFKKYKVKKCLLYHRNSSILLSILTLAHQAIPFQFARIGIE